MACRGPGHKGRRGRAVLVLAGLLLLGANPAGAVTPGELLTQALAELRRAGLPVIFSSGLIDPAMTVTVDPGEGPPEVVARRILAPHGLTLEQIRPRLFTVVKVPPATPAATQIVPSTAENPGLARDPEVDIYASRYGVDPAKSANHRSTDTSRQDLETMPALFQDAMRAMRMMPGIATSAISARPHVRGGREDELAIYFDGVPLYQPFHFKNAQSLLGTLDPEALSRLNFFSGVFPARFGDRLSGVLDLQPRTWDGQNHYELSQSLLFSEALTQGRLDSSPLQWLSSIRVGAVGVLADLLDRTTVEPQFMDALGRLQYDIGDSQIAVGYLFLDDSVDATFKTTVNASPALKDLTSSQHARMHHRDGTEWLGWTFLPSETSSLHATLSRTERHTFRFGTLIREGAANSTLEDARHFGTIAARIDSTVNLGPQWQLNSGLEWDDYAALYNFRSTSAFDPRLAVAFARPTAVARMTDRRVDGQAYAVYTSVLRTFGSGWAMDVGVRWDGQRYGTLFDANQVSPRVGLQYRIEPDTIVRAGWGRFSQTQRPDELQIEDGDNVFHPAERETQSVLSLERRLAPWIQFHLEAFDKRISSPRQRFENLLDPISLLPEIEVDRFRIRPSSSRVVGTELSVRWSAGEHWLGWGHYSWSEATDHIGSRTYYRSWDQKHAAALGVAWRRSPWLLSATADWHTGWRRNGVFLTSRSPPTVARTQLNLANWQPNFSVDVRAAWTHPLPKGSIELFGEMDNATNHANPCCVDVQVQEDMRRPLLERTTSVWLPRFVFVGASWKLP